MGGLKSALQKLVRLRGVPEARRLTERAVAPYLRADLHSLELDRVSTIERMEHLGRLIADTDARISSQIADMANAIEQIERHQPAVLNAITSTNGTARVLRRELERVNEHASQAHQSIEAVYDHIHRLEHDTATGDANVLKEVIPHLDTLSWLVERVEMNRAEVMNEIRYGRRPAAASTSGALSTTPTRIVNAAALTPSDGVLRVNLGAGHVPLSGFVNVDIRELPGIDIVADIGDLPFELGSLTEIFSAHTLEHFPEEELRRRLLPYWVGLLHAGGAFRAVVPDMEAMTKSYTNGSIAFGTFREVAYGGQEYGGDFHFTGFTPSTLAALLEETGLADAKIVAQGRQNGDCLECEVVATRPAA